MAGLTVGGTESENLLTRSEAFDSGDWSKANATVTADDAVAPDGTSTSDRIESDSDASHSRVEHAVSGLSDNTVYVHSEFLKAGTVDWAVLFFVTKDHTFIRASFDLANGVVGTEYNGPAASSIESVGDGWYRCAIAVDVVSGGTTPDVWVSVAASDSASPPTDTGDYIYAWGAQLEEGSEPGIYVTTTSTSESTVVNGTTLTVAEGSMSRDEVEIGDRMRTFQGTQRQRIRNRVNEWSGQTIPLTETDKDTVLSTLRSSTQPQTCAGDLVVSLGDLVDCFTSVEGIDAVLASTGQRHVVRFRLMESS